jgi:hypothetical protein
MPHAPASGKARAGDSSHAVALEHFPASGMIDLTPTAPSPAHD